MDNFQINQILLKTDTSKIETVINSLETILENFDRLKSSLIKNSLVSFLCSLYIEVYKV